MLSGPRPAFRILPSPRRGTRAAHLRLIDVVQSLRFLVAGGIATAINWAARFPLSLVFPFDVAVALAYGVGMVAGFVLYRGWVFKGSGLLLHHQLWRFLAVNGVGLAMSVANDMSGFGSGRHDRILIRRVACCRRFGWPGSSMRLGCIVRRS